MSQPLPISRAGQALFPLAALLGLTASWLALREHVAMKSGVALQSSVCHVSAQINCQAVLASAYSDVFGIPLASYGITFYLLVLAVSIGLVARIVPPAKAIPLLAAFAVIGGVVSALLLTISISEIGVVCPLCILTYLANSFLLIGALLAAHRTGGVGRSVASGCIAILQFPVRAFSPSLRAKERFQAISATFAAAALALSALSLPEQWLRKTYRYRPAPPSVVSALDSWRLSPTQDVSLVFEGASRDYVRGNPSAPITILEFADFECPACRAFHPQIEALVDEFSEKIRFILKGYPLSSQCNPSMPRDLHPLSCPATTYARCAGEQGRYWESVHALFTMQALEHGGTIAELEKGFSEFAVSHGIDMDALRSCMESDHIRAKIRKDISEAEDLGLESTPSVWINGKRVSPPTIDRVRQVILHLIGAP